MTNNNKYSWNQTLKFSWGHIIAFVALIIISYVAYMGDFYQNGGNFKYAAIKVCSIDIVLLITFIGAQIFKGTNEKFDRSLIIERILICLCPIAFIWAMLPYNHFWNVFSEREQIESMFNTSIEKSRQMFVDYDQYSNDRIRMYENTLDNIIRNKTQNPNKYRKAGFDGSNDNIIKGNYVETLKLQLLSENIDSLCLSASAWIEKASQNTSVWNAFLVGNVKNISNAIKGWNETLSDVSKPILSNETISGNDIHPFDENKESYKTANNGFAELNKIYTEAKGFSFTTLWSGIILFFMILFPYLLQKRNEKAKGYYYLIPSSIKNNQIYQEMQHKTNNKKKEDNDDIFEQNDNTDNPINTPYNSVTNNDDDIYGGTF